VRHFRISSVTGGIAQIMLPERDGPVNRAPAQSLAMFPRDFRVHFSVKIFFDPKENKVQIFSCPNEKRFLISSRWQGAKIVGVNKM
jgi:hypothetical protein